MTAIPLTLTIGLCLAFTLVVFFLREQARLRTSRMRVEHDTHSALLSNNDGLRH
jgi:hypothetical protein